MTREWILPHSDHLWEAGQLLDGRFGVVMRCRRPSCNRVWYPWQQLDQQGACSGDTTQR
jgi:hypothetical protein